MMRLLSIIQRAILIVGFLAVGSVPRHAIAAPDQLTFASPDEAVSALIDAAKQGDLNRLFAVLGPGSEELIRSGDPNADAATRQKFVAAYDARHQLMEVNAGHDVLNVGVDDWPLPIPVVRIKERWRFDSRAGARQIVDRRIGRNEIVAIRVAVTYVDAQKAYFEQRAQTGGSGEYAQRLISAPDQHDGLYWPVTAGEPESPFGPLVAQAVEEGYPGDVEAGRQIPYQGYYFRILKAQGENAPGGHENYVANGRMTGGFALLAWPANYGSSGIMTFTVNQDGVVFQKNLGRATTVLTATMTTFDPDVTWTRVDVTAN